MRKIQPFHLSFVYATLLGALLLTGTTSCRDHDQSISPVLLQINSKTITLAEFNHRFEQTIPPGRTLAQDEREELKRSFLRQVIDRELALTEAQRLNLAVTAAEVEERLTDMRSDYPAGEFETTLRSRGMSLDQWRHEIENRLLIDKVLEQAVYSQVSVSDHEVADYYEENREEFVRPLQVRARQIMVDHQEQGQEILAQLQQGASFVEMAEQFSLSPDGEHGGDLGFFPEGEMPSEFDRIVFSLPRGEISELIKSDYGYHIFLVEELQPAQNLSLEKASAEIRARLRREKEEAARQAWLMELGGKAHLEVNWPLL